MTQRNPVIEEDLDAILLHPLPWFELYGKTVLVTGASGFLGAYLLDTLARLNERGTGPTITLLALARNQNRLHDRLPHLVNRTDVRALIQDVTEPLTTPTAPNFIIHAASEASPRHYLAQPVDTIRANALGTLHLLDFARSHGSRLLFLSSGAVYGGHFGTGEALSETSFGPLDPLDPRACYGESKRIAETLCGAYASQHGVHTTIARISHTYGPGLELDDGRVFIDLVAQILQGQDIVLHGDGLEQRPFCYITDMIAGLFTVLLRGHPGQAYNLGATSELSIRELATLLLELNGDDRFSLRLGSGSPLASAHRSSGHFDIGKAAALGWHPRVPAKQGFARMLSYYRHH
ncbi:NAD-dependent epimerase/dehydratase family protein [Oryzomicrobium sp.]|uniref:NAD-dependent epimerase/dehydratase family protein n=1 Tax=Oryzomicrobium sp. TaxID=1911578 RepID=UPI002FE074C1